MTALGTQAERREQRPVLRERLVDRPDRLVAGGVVVGARADEREHLVRVGDGDGAVAELLEQLVGDRPGGALGQATAELGQRRLQQFEDGSLAPRTAHAGHDRIVHVTDEILAAASRAVRRRRSSWTGTARSASAEYELATYNPARTHDVTLFILDPAERIALIRKPQFADGIWRPPGGGVKPGEDFAAGAVREALEETGLRVSLDRYLVDAHASFRYGASDARRGARTSSPRGRRRACSRRRTQTRSPARAGARSTSWRARYASGCSRPAARSGAIASRCTTRRSTQRSRAC